MEIQIEASWNKLGQVKTSSDKLKQVQGKKLNRENSRKFLDLSYFYIFPQKTFSIYFVDNVIQFYYN